jgi:hypothetical protein
MTKAASATRWLGATAIILPILLAGCGNRTDERGSTASLHPDSVAGTPPKAGVQPSPDVRENGAGQAVSPQTGTMAPGSPRPER